MELTIMVTTNNLSAYNGIPPEDGEDRKIVGGPLYGLAKVQELAGLQDTVKFWTRRCASQAANLTLDPSDVGHMICELREHDYRDSEWCDNGKGYWAACDSYTLTRDEYLENAGKWFRMEYFLKFAESKTGKLVLIVSCHTSN